MEAFEHPSVRAPASARDLVLPAELAAREPVELRGGARDAVRLLVSGRRGEAPEHRRFCELPQLLQAGDLLVVNDSATLPAALVARSRLGHRIVLHCSTQIAGMLWIVEPRAGGDRGRSPLPEPECSHLALQHFTLPGGAAATLVAPVHRESSRLWYARLDLPEPAVEYLHAYGAPINYAYVDGTFGLAAYQTIFARVPGSAEMPSAGRPFTRRALDALATRGIEIVAVTLHTGGVESGGARASLRRALQRQ